MLFRSLGSIELGEDVSEKVAIRISPTIVESYVPPQVIVCGSESDGSIQEIGRASCRERV